MAQSPTPRRLLSGRQRQLLEAIETYSRTTTEPCPASYLARRFTLTRTTVREHLSALYRKGWLRTPNSPSSLVLRPSIPAKVRRPPHFGGSTRAADGASSVHEAHGDDSANLSHG
jgi:DNA-binding FadR family transcriptional regulator